MLFETLAHAMGADGVGAPGAQPNPIMSFLPLIAMFAIFYFLLIRPQQKKAKIHREMLASLKKGDYILTGGGIYGRIVSTAEDVLTVDVGNDMKLKINRAFVQGLAENAPKREQEEKK